MAAYVIAHGVQLGQRRNLDQTVVVRVIVVPDRDRELQRCRHGGRVRRHQPVGRRRLRGRRRVGRHGPRGRIEGQTARQRRGRIQRIGQGPRAPPRRRQRRRRLRLPDRERQGRFRDRAEGRPRVDRHDHLQRGRIAVRIRRHQPVGRRRLRPLRRPAQVQPRRIEGQPRRQRRRRVKGVGQRPVTPCRRRQQHGFGHAHKESLRHLRRREGRLGIRLRRRDRAAPEQARSQRQDPQRRPQAAPIEPHGSLLLISVRQADPALPAALSDSALGRAPQRGNPDPRMPLGRLHSQIHLITHCGGPSVARTRGGRPAPRQHPRPRPSEPRRTNRRVRLIADQP